MIRLRLTILTIVVVLMIGCQGESFNSENSGGWFTQFHDQSYSGKTPVVGPNKYCKVGDWYSPGVRKDMNNVVVSSGSKAYVLGLGGQLTCLDVSSMQFLWSMDIPPLQTSNTNYGFKQTPKRLALDEQRTRLLIGWNQNLGGVNTAPADKLIMVNLVNKTIMWSFDVQLMNDLSGVHQPNYQEYVVDIETTGDIFLIGQGTPLGFPFTCVSVFRISGQHGSMVNRTLSNIWCPSFNSGSRSSTLFFSRPGLFQTTNVLGNGTLALALPLTKDNGCNTYQRPVLCGGSWNYLGVIDLIHENLMWNTTHISGLITPVVGNHQRLYVVRTFLSAQDIELLSYDIVSGLLNNRLPLDFQPSGHPFYDSQSDEITMLYFKISSSDKSTYSTNYDAHINKYSGKDLKKLSSVKLDISTSTSTTSSSSSDIAYFDFMEKTALVYTLMNSKTLFSFNTVTGKLEWNHAQTTASPTPTPSGSPTPSPANPVQNPKPALQTMVIGPDSSMLLLHTGEGRVEKIQCKDDLGFLLDWKIILMASLIILNTLLGCFGAIRKKMKGNTGYGSLSSDYTFQDDIDNFVKFQVFFNVVVTLTVLGVAAFSQVEANQEIGKFSVTFSDLPKFKEDFLKPVCDPTAKSAAFNKTALCFCTGLNLNTSLCKASACANADTGQTCEQITEQLCDCEASFYQYDCNCNYNPTDSKCSPSFQMNKKLQPKLDEAFASCRDHYTGLVQLLWAIFGVHCGLGLISMCVRGAVILGGDKKASICMSVCSSIVSAIMISIAASGVAVGPVCTAGTKSLLTYLPSCTFNQSFIQENIEAKLIAAINAAIIVHASKPVMQVINAIMDVFR